MLGATRVAVSAVLGARRLVASSAAYGALQQTRPPAIAAHAMRQHGAGRTCAPQQALLGSRGRTFPGRQPCLQWQSGGASRCVVSAAAGARQGGKESLTPDGAGGAQGAAPALGVVAGSVKQWWRDTLGRIRRCAVIIFWRWTTLLTNRNFAARRHDCCCRRCFSAGHVHAACRPSCEPAASWPVGCRPRAPAMHASPHATLSQLVGVRQPCRDSRSATVGQLLDAVDLNCPMGVAGAGAPGSGGTAPVSFWADYCRHKSERPEWLILIEVRNCFGDWWLCVRACACVRGRGGGGRTKGVGRPREKSAACR